MKLLVIGPVPGAPQAWSPTAATADSPEEASHLVASLRPDALVVWASGWGAAWVAQLPPEARPPVLLVGPLAEGPVAP
jgi:hypothetical protein